MSTSSERPRLRVVDGTSESDPPPAAKESDVTGLSPVIGQAKYVNALLSIDLTDPAAAYGVACSARSVLGAAMDIRRAAAAAAPHAFYRGITPGEKSVEAAEVIVRQHLYDAWRGEARADDLRKAALRAADEISTARRIAATAGIDVTSACEAHLHEAISGLNVHTSVQSAPYQRAQAPTTLIGSFQPQAAPSSTPTVLAALFGGVLLGLFASWVGSRVSAPTAVLPARRYG